MKREKSLSLGRYGPVIWTRFQNMFDRMLKMEILYVRVTQILLPVYPDIIYLLKCESL